ncbi:MAG: glucose-6-phosphate dehydrogenase, partial [Pseudohongiella sp.]|nr:glucose-6-phosphate dehydrogenase [Pseudohongiella sp.]
MICDILIIGGDGDLAYRKLYPALFHLDEADCLPACLRIVSVSRTALNAADFRNKVLLMLTEYCSAAPLN